MSTEFGRFKQIRIPPQSTGPALHNYTRQEVVLGSVSGPIQTGSLLVGLNSGTVATVVSAREDGATWTVSAIVLASSTGLAYQNGESVTAGSTTATAISSQTIYTPAQIMVGGNDPFNSAAVDSAGSLFIRFAEGPQQLDAFGLTRTSTPFTIAEYNFAYGDDFVRWQNLTDGGGSVTYLPNESTVALDVGSDNGDSASKTTNLFHRYSPGKSRMAMMTVACGDDGKSGVVRRWGYYSETDGLFFEQTVDGVFAVLRSSVTGSVVDTRVPQDEWNVDVVDGSNTPANLSKFTLNTDRMNLYWIDLQWLGAGQVRFGIYNRDGDRITCHRFENAGDNNTAYMQTASLPIRMEIVNQTATASPSRIKMTCAVIQDEGERIQESEKSFIRSFSYTSPKVENVEDSEKLVFAIRPAATYNSKPNRVIITPLTLDVFSSNEPVIIRLWAGAQIVGGSWDLFSAASPTEFNDTGEFNGGTFVARAFFADTGHSNISFIDEGIIATTLADGSNIGRHLGITAESLNGEPTTVKVILNWQDVF